MPQSPRPLVHVAFVTAVRIASAAVTTSGVAASRITALVLRRAAAALVLITILVLLLRILNLTRGRGYSLHLLAVAIVAGDYDGGRSGDGSLICYK